MCLTQMFCKPRLSIPPRQIGFSHPQQLPLPLLVLALLCYTLSAIKMSVARLLLVSNNQASISLALGVQVMLPESAALAANLVV